MPTLALSALGRDQPGIVAAVTRVLLDHRVNIEDSQMTILRGHFAMILVLAAPEGTDVERLASRLSEGTRGLVEEMSLREIEDAGTAGPEPSHIVTVYGVDHPGIVHASAQALADRGVDITDLNTRLVEDEGTTLYVLMMELALPAGTEPDVLEAALAEVGRREGVDVTLRELERDEL